jgi:aromatic-L-amino-acid decarboxylase
VPGDIPEPELRKALHRAADEILDYLTGVERYRVLPDVEPGAVRAALAASPPREGEALDLILDEYKRVVEPNVTHWNHPGFMAYFSISGSAPGIVGEALAAALNVNAMLWRTSPAATELERTTCDWLRQMLGLPEEFSGHINDTASMSTLLALAAARHRVDPDSREHGLAGRPERAPLTVYASDQAHSSVDKAAIALGLGRDNVRRVASDGSYRLRIDELAASLRQDRQGGRQPLAVVATAGTTSTTSVDPLPEIAQLCHREGLWLHVDAAYAGSAAVCAEYRPLLAGWEAADSIVVNPHKWLFTPIDCSVLLVRDEEILKQAFSVVPEYLRSAPGEDNLMDLGVQLGRRFRALKLWMVIRAFGVEGLAERIRCHCELARLAASWIAADEDFELMAPVPFSTVCFRWLAGDDEEARDRANEELLARVNAGGKVFISHTTLGDRTVLRLAVGNIRTDRRHVEGAWQEIKRASEGLGSGTPFRSSAGREEPGGREQ